MTHPEKGLPSDSNLASPKEEIGRLAEGLARLHGALEDAKIETGAVAAEVRSVASRLARLERTEPRGSRQGWVQPSASKPVPVDPANPTVGEIRRHILYHLYRTDCWNGKHTSGEHLRRGYMSRIEQRRVREEIQQLQSEGLLIPHGKSADEHYSLNPQEAQRIYRELGISIRATLDGRNSSPLWDNPASTTESAKRGQLPTFVEMGRFENTVRSLRSSVDEGGRTARALGEGLVAQSRACKEACSRLESRISQLESRLEAVEQRIPTQSIGFSGRPVDEGAGPVCSGGRDR